MHAAFSANVQHSAVDSLAVDSANISVAVIEWHRDMDSVTIHTPFAQLFVDGKIGTAPGHTGELRYVVSVDTLAALRRWLASPDSGVVQPRPAILAAAIARAKADSARQANRNEVAYRATGRPQPQIKLDSLRALRKDSVDGALRTAGIVRGTISDFNVRGRLVGRAHHRARQWTAIAARVEYAVIERRHAADEVRRRRVDRLALGQRLRARLGDDPGDVCCSHRAPWSSRCIRIPATCIARARIFC